MKRFDVYQQRYPINSKVDGPTLSDWTKLTPFEINLIHVGQVLASSGEEAIEMARQNLGAFKGVSRKTLAAFPIVSPA